MSDGEAVDTLELATELTGAWLANPNSRVTADEVPALLERLHGTLNNLTAPLINNEEAPEQEQFPPAVSVRKSLASKDHILSMIDGKPYKTLRRHLTRHGLTPEQYRKRYGLKPDYPMLAENYSQVRRDMASRIGLGRKPSLTIKAAAPVQSEKLVKRKRKAVTQGKSGA